MNEKLKKFMEEVSKDADLANKINTASKETIIEIAKAKGIELTEEDFAIPANQELSDDELAAVAGGVGYCECAFSGDGAGDGLSCGCYLLGNGEGNVKNDNCTCFGPGAGHTEDWKNDHWK